VRITGCGVRGSTAVLGVPQVRVRVPTTQTIAHVANVALRPVVGVICLYEPIALVTSLPSVSELSRRHRVLAPIILLGLAAHFYWPPTPPRNPRSD